jgi:hypothetical protein
VSNFTRRARSEIKTEKKTQITRQISGNSPFSSDHKMFSKRKYSASSDGKHVMASEDDQQLSAMSLQLGCRESERVFLLE